MTKETVAKLADLGNFSDPDGAAARVQADTLEMDLRAYAAENPDMLFQIDDGEPQTIADILHELDEDDAAIAALAAALRGAVE